MPRQPGSLKQLSPFDATGSSRPCPYHRAHWCKDHVLHSVVTGPIRPPRHSSLKADRLDIHVEIRQLWAVTSQHTPTCRGILASGVLTATPQTSTAWFCPRQIVFLCRPCEKRTACGSSSKSRPVGVATTSACLPMRANIPGSWLQQVQTKHQEVHRPASRRQE